MLLRETVIELQPGSVLDSRYQIRRVVGKGATGVVLEADDRVTRELVALKVFKPEIATDERWQEIVGSELRHARLLQHPNVCRFFDAGEADGYRFLSLEYASGGSLRQQLREGSSDRPMEDRVADARAVVNGLAAIHRAGIIHRDVKPDNVLRMADGRLVVTDFGLAVAPGQTTFVSGYSGAVGTPSYMAPEVALGGDATMASDVFSLGVILHEIFFDRRPTWDTTKRGRFLISPVEGSNSRVARAMARMCAECLEELAPRRPGNAEEVRKRFERAVLGRTGSALEALRTGKGALVLGVVGATLAATGVFVATRPVEGTVKARITGTAADWRSGARVVARREGRLNCLYPGADRHTVRAIWGKPSVPEVIDLSTGRASPWPLAPELVARGCPDWTADGRFVAFNGGPGNADIMISANADGSAARRVASGFGPRWLPGGRELVFEFGRRRVAVSDLVDVPQILPEAPGATATEEVLFNLAVSHRGGRVAALFRQPGTKRSAVLTYRFPSWDLEARIEVESDVSRVIFPGGSDELSLVVEEPAGSTLAVLKPDGDLVRRGQLTGSTLVDLMPTSSGPVVVTEQRTVTAMVRSPGGQQRALLVAPALGGVSVSSDHSQVVMERLLEDGRWVIAHYDGRASRLTQLTAGPHDRSPLILPGGREFLFLERDEKRRVRACSVEVPSSCRTVFEETTAFTLLGVSPTAQQIAYVSLQALQSRLRVITLPAGTTSDLGPLSSFCQVRWPSEERLWSFERSADFTGWTEMNIPGSAATGRREPESVLGPDRCPVPAADGVLRLVPRWETSLYQLLVVR
jgi:hypothetical protein